MCKKILHITMALPGYPWPQGGFASHLGHENYDEVCPDVPVREQAARSPTGKQAGFVSGNGDNGETLPIKLGSWTNGMKLASDLWLYQLLA